MISFKFLLVMAILIATVQCRKNKPPRGGECPDGQECPDKPQCEGDDCPDKPPCDGDDCQEGGPRDKPPCEGDECSEDDDDGGKFQQRRERLRELRKKAQDRLEKLKGARDKLVGKIKGKSRDGAEVECDMLVKQGDGTQLGKIHYG